MTKSTHKGGKPPFGYTWEQGELVINPEEAPIVSEIFDLFLVHQRKGTVAKLISQKGHRTRTGKRFQYSAVMRILTNPTMKGIHRYSIAEKGTGKNVTYESAVEPIVTPQIWDQVAEILSNQKGQQSRTPTQDVFMGLVYCGCHIPMDIASKSKGYSCRKCGETIEFSTIHTLVESSFEGCPYPTVEPDSSTGNPDDLTKRTKAEIRKLNTEIDKLFELYSANIITTSEFEKRHKNHQFRLSELKATIEKSNKPPKKSHKSLLEFWELAPTPSKRLIAETLIESISLESNTATLSLYPLFNFDQHVHVSKV